MKCRKKERIEKIKQLVPKYQMTSDEKATLAIDEDFIFFIKNNKPINSHLQIEQIEDYDDYFQIHHELGNKKMNEWNLKI